MSVLTDPVFCLDFSEMSEKDAGSKRIADAKPTLSILIDALAKAFKLLNAYITGCITTVLRQFNRLTLPFY